MFTIAGVTGHVGSATAKALIAQGKKVRVLVRDAAKGAPWKDQAEVVVARLDDREALTSALRGAEGAFVLLPPDYAAPDMRAYQRALGEVIAGAVHESGVPHVALLSSVGADQSEKTGVILGLHWLEEGLRASGAKLTSLRAGFFQENALATLEAARTRGIYPSFAPKDVAFPMIATRDIGAEAARVLSAGASAHSVVDIHGPSASAVQIAELLGKLLGKSVQAVEVPPAEHAAAMVQAGFPRGIAELYAEMYAAFGTGKIRPVGDRFVQGTTTLEETLRAYVA